MRRDKPQYMAASVHDRLLNLAREQKEELQHLLTRFSLERLLYRLSQSQHRDAFVLKGAMLFALWSKQRHRPTKDLDLLGKGEISVAQFEQTFREICKQPVPDDGLLFNPETVHAEPIREEEEYKGLRIQFLAMLGNARIPIQVDIAFGDVITPEVIPVACPVLLGFPAPVLAVYPRETVVAEKFQAMVKLGITNSRMKDFHDVWVLASEFAFEGRILSRAIKATFERRRTALPSQTPPALSAEFYGDGAKNKQWTAFVRKNKLDAQKVTLEQVVNVLYAFLMPPTQALARAELFEDDWPAAGPWKSEQITGKETLMADEPFAAYQSQHLLMLAGQGRVLSDAERTRLTADQLLILHAMGQALSAQDRTRLTPAQLMLLAGKGLVLSDIERTRLTADLLLILHALGQPLSAQDRTRLTPTQLMKLAGQGLVLSDVERARLTADQLLILYALGQPLSAQDRTRLTPIQMMKLAAAGEQLSDSERERLTGAQLLNLFAMGQPLSAADRTRLTSLQLLSLQVMDG